MKRIRGREDAYTGFWWGNLKKRPLGRPRHRLEDNIKMDLQKVGCAGMDWIELTGRDRWWAFLKAKMRLRVA